MSEHRNGATAGQLIVSVSSLTGTHGLDLARQMASRGLLGRFYTTLPGTRTARVPTARTRRFLALTPIVALGMNRWLPVSDEAFYWLVYRAFDHWLARTLEPCDIIQCLAGCGLETLRRARSTAGAAGVCDSGTSHVRFLRAIVTDEHQRWGVASEPEPERFTHRIVEEYEAAELITVPSTFAKKSFIDQGVDKEKIVVTPYGADRTDYHPVPKRDETFRILFVGSLSLRKGVHYLLDAVSHLRFDDSELVLRGGETSSTDMILRRYVGTIPLKLVGPQPRSEMKVLFSQASVLVLPSIEDGFGLVIAQAMACGVPVIASTHSGGPDLITEGVEGFLVQPRAVRTLEERLSALYEDRELLSRMGQSALRRITALGGWTSYGDAVERAYRSILERRH
jgi:starch synthase